MEPMFPLTFPRDSLSDFSTVGIMGVERFMKKNNKKFSKVFGTSMSPSENDLGKYEAKGQRDREYPHYGVILPEQNDAQKDCLSHVMRL